MNEPEPDPAARPPSDPPTSPVPSLSAAAARLTELECQRRRVEAEIAALIDEVHCSGTYGEDGHRSVSGWIRTHSRCPHGEATARRRVGRLAAADERFSAALSSGRIGVAQARRLGRAFAQPRCGPQLLDGELLDVLLEHAANMPYEDFARVVDSWERLADVDGADQGAAAAHERRTAHVSVVGDEVVVRANGGLGQGAVIAEVFARYCDAEFAADWERNRAEHGEDATAATMARTDAQRRFDALERIFVDAAGANTPAGREPVPLVNIVVDVATLDALLHDEATVAAPADPRVRRCETTRGVPIPTRDVVSALWWGRIRRVVVDSAGVVVDMGRTTRLFTGSARDAVMMASTTCVMAGCTVPVSSCDADHMTEWQHGGRTCVHNGCPLCRHHNRFKSRSGYRVHRDADGYWHTERPDGTELTDRRTDRGDAA